MSVDQRILQIVLARWHNATVVNIGNARAKRWMAKYARPMVPPPTRPAA